MRQVLVSRLGARANPTPVRGIEPRPEFAAPCRNILIYIANVDGKVLDVTKILLERGKACATSAKLSAFSCGTRLGGLCPPALPEQQFFGVPNFGGCSRRCAISIR